MRHFLTISYCTDVYRQVTNSLRELVSTLNFPHSIRGAVGAGAEPALPCGESSVFFLRTAVTSLTACFGLTFADLLIYCTNGFSLQVISKRALTFNTRVLSKS